MAEIEVTYETIDWDAEAKRVVAAFGVEEECPFRPTVSHYMNFQSGTPKEITVRDTMTLTGLMEDSNDVALRNGLSLRLEYKSQGFDAGRFITIFDERQGRGTSISISWNGQMNQSGWPICPPFHFALEIAEGLSNLNLLTPEIEEHFRIHISAHQKLEWTLEYEARLKANQ